jgi:hypothetical protein
MVTFPSLVRLGALVAILALPMATAAELAAVLRLPELAQERSWTVTGAPAAGLGVGERAGWLEASFRAAKGNTGRLLLRTPVAIPDWASDLTFRCTNNGATSGLRLRAVISDASGAEFRFQTVSRFSFKGGVFFPEHNERRVREERFHTPGLARPVPVTQAGGTVMPPHGNLVPQRPFTLLGFELDGEQQKPDDSQTWLYATDFALTRLTPTGTSGHYLFRDQEQFAELEPAPFLTLGDFGRWYGRRFDLAWEVCADYAGQPVLAGAQSVRLPTLGWDEGPGRDYPIRLAQRLTLPTLGEGTWWVRVKVRWFRGETPQPDEILTRDYRLDVVKGAAVGRLLPWPAAADLPGTLIRIAPERTSLIWAADEAFRLDLRFSKPEAATCLAVVEVRNAGDGQLVRQQELTPAWDAAGRAVLTVDLADLPAGSYRVRGLLRSGERVIDEITRQVGRQATAVAAVPALPAGVLKALDLRDGARAMFPLRPIVDDGLRKDPQSDWDTYLRPFLDRAGELSHDLELAVAWNEVEQQPGVFDWRGVDRFIDAAGKRGLQVLLCPEFRAGAVPEWLPGRFVRDPAGRISGSTAYTFHGVRPDYVHAAAVRDGVQGFVSAMAKRYAGHVGVQGYFLCFEHPCDAPWAGWFEGYSPEAIAAFRAHAKQNLGSLDELNRRWRSDLRTWADLIPPSRLGTFSDRCWLDWTGFRAASIDGFLKGLVESVRAVDAQRLIVVYGDGVRDFPWYRDRGCMLANGGSHDAMQIPGYAAMGLLGIAERTEDHSPGNWSAYFPTQLDASVFAMTMGGGANTHCKAFVRTRFAFKDAEDPEVSLGRYRRFQPIWQALRQTGPPPIDTVLFTTADGARSTYGAWGTDTWAFLNAMQAHVPVALGYADLWQKARLLILPTGQATLLEDASMDRIATYAEQGGTLLMWAESGRRSVDRPDEDWVLLRRFGFTPPAKPNQPDKVTKAQPVPGDIFPATATAFTLRGCWDMPAETGGTVAAHRADDPTRPVMSWRQVGKGRVLVVWAETALPPMNLPADAGYPFLRDIARWAGARLTTDSDQPLFWLNLLADRDGRTWYGLVHLGQWQGVPKAAAKGQVRWPGLPDGTYAVSEMISGRELGTLDAATLRGSGIDVDLAPRAVAVFRFRAPSSEKIP